VPGGICAPKSLISRPVFGSPGLFQVKSLRILFVGSLFFVAAATQSAMAQDAQAFNGDAKRGQQLAYTCNGCHAIPNYKNVYPTYSVPKLRGQRPQYIVAALKAYKSGDRSHGTMHSHAASMSEQDMADIAAYVAGPAVLTESKNDVKADARPKASETCLACHGTNGVGITPDYPTISGQHRDYIARALHDYQKGGRKNLVMAPMVQNLTRADIEELAAYYSGQKPALQTVPQKDAIPPK
jgi:cytochrome c553